MKALRAPLVRALGLTARSFHACLRSGPHKPTVSHPLNRFGGNISRTAGFVGMERSALHRKLKSLGVVSSSKNGSVAEDDEDE